jgi:pimeloyl-ACP methyl ester carboxylesterase
VKITNGVTVMKGCPDLRNVASRRHVIKGLATASVGGLFLPAIGLTNQPQEDYDPMPTDQTTKGFDAIRNGIGVMTVDGLSIRYARGGQSQGTPIVLTSPWPESIYAFRDIWLPLSAEAPLIAFDLPGFGRSEGRPSVLSVDGMGDFLIRVIDKLGLKQLHAIGPDVGTSAWLTAAYRSPARFQSLIVGSGLADMASVTGGLKTLIEAPSMDGFLGKDGGDLAVASVSRMAKNAPPAAVLEDYRLSSAGPRFVEASAYVRSYPKALPHLAQSLSRVTAPVLVISGRNDPIVPASNGEYLKPYCCTHLGRFSPSF